MCLAGSVSPADAQQPFVTETQRVALREAADRGAPFAALRHLTQLHRVPATIRLSRDRFLLTDDAAEALIEVTGRQMIMTEAGRPVFDRYLHEGEARHSRAVKQGDLARAALSPYTPKADLDPA